MTRDNFNPEKVLRDLEGRWNDATMTKTLLAEACHVILRLREDVGEARQYASALTTVLNRPLR